MRQGFEKASKNGVDLRVSIMEDKFDDKHVDRRIMGQSIGSNLFQMVICKRNIGHVMSKYTR